MLVTAAQIVERTQQNGAYAAVLKGLLAAFDASEQGAAFDAEVLALLQRVSEDPEAQRFRDKTAYYERRVLEHFQRAGTVERLETEARNFLLAPTARAAQQRAVAQAVDEIRAAGGPTSRTRPGTVSRPLEVDPPSHGSRGGGRSHSYYRRGDSVAALVSVAEPLRQDPDYACLGVEIAACDAARGMYTVRDPDVPSGARDSWVVSWDQILAIKRPYEHVYRAGDQVYALFRDDYAADTAVSTEYYPGRVEQVASMSLAVRFDTGEVGHVYYDEVFAAGRVGFLRHMSDERRRHNGPGAMVQVGGRMVPSFTGFWPGSAHPTLGNRGRRVRYRPTPPILVEHPPHSAVRQPSPAHSSDMDIDNPSAPPSPARHTEPPRRPSRFDQGPRSIADAQAVARPLAAIPSPGEDSEIDGGEEGEVREPARPREPSRNRSRWDQRSPPRRSRSRSRQPDQSRDRSRTPRRQDSSRYRTPRHHDDRPPWPRMRSRSRSRSPGRRPPPPDRGGWRSPAGSHYRR
ncbi:hypothetical protein H4R19_001133 [Coemansia spiralis]|nr:hypothetical protein H4R19_001133 [Coemansia spiralis]